MASKLIPALERIAYQSRSAFANDVIKLCQDTWDDVMDLAEDGKMLEGLEVIRDMQKFTKFTKGLEEAITKHTGIPARAYVMYGGGAPNAYMMPRFTKFDEIDDSQIWEAVRRMGGGGQMKRTRSFSQVLSDLSKNIDVNTGKLARSYRGSYQMDVGLAVECFTSMHNYGERGFPPKEIAAIILHEIGHGVTLAENFGNAFYRATEALDSVSLLSDTNTPSEHVAHIKDVRSAVSTITDAKRKSKYEELLDRAEALDDKSEAAVASHIALDIIVGRCIGLWMLPMLSLLRTLPAGRTLISKKIFTSTGLEVPAEVKRSDTMRGARSFSVTERIADEYVSRHGMGAYLASALVKLSDESAYRRVQGALGVRALAGVFTGIVEIMSITTPCPASIPGTTPYDEPIERIDILLQNNMSFFKDAAVPKDMQTEWVRETEALLRRAKEARNTAWSQKIRKFIWNTLFRMTGMGSISGAVVNANLQADYSKLQDITRHLIRNQLYFRAAQVKEVINRTKA